MRQKLNRPYDLIESKTSRHIFVFGGFAFGMIFLWVFEPYGFHNLSDHEKLISIGYYFGASLIPLSLQFYVFQDIIIKRYTILNTILSLIVSTLLIVFSQAIINSFLLKKADIIWSLIFYLWVIPSIQILPILIFILIHYNWTLKKHLRLALQVNSSLNDAKRTQVNNERVAEINSDNKKEYLKVSLNSLLFITSVDNYIELNLLDKDNICKKLLRYSLSRVEQDNKELSELFRCHKSYIVNRGKIDSIIGNATGYKIKLANCDVLIPVSRKWNKNIQSMLIN